MANRRLRKELLETARGLYKLGAVDDKTMRELWIKEAKDRLAAHRRGEIKAIPLEHVLAKYRGK
ncbi:MAG TPA: addiction module protein [Burkholderiales bacterium]|nr:addiction module protein [Burkholderiales bacterium]